MNEEMGKVTDLVIGFIKDDYPATDLPKDLEKAFNLIKDSILEYKDNEDMCKLITAELEAALAYKRALTSDY